MREIKNEIFNLFYEGLLKLVIAIISISQMKFFNRFGDKHDLLLGQKRMNGQ